MSLATICYDLYYILRVAFKKRHLKKEVETFSLTRVVRVLQIIFLYILSYKIIL